MKSERILEAVNAIKVGDKIRINDWDNPMTVTGVSEHYIVAHDCNDDYTVISKLPYAGIRYNGVERGDIYCGTDYWIMGFWDGYRFDDPEWNERYLASFESSETEIGRNRAKIYLLKVIT